MTCDEMLEGGELQLSALVCVGTIDVRFGGRGARLSRR
jgi:hypothetical protein